MARLNAGAPPALFQPQRCDHLLHAAALGCLDRPEEAKPVVQRLLELDGRRRYARGKFSSTMTLLLSGKKSWSIGGWLMWFSRHLMPCPSSLL